MKSFGKVVVKCRHLIMALALILMVPAVWGYLHTRVNYDILTYLPDSIETIQGQNILMDDFGTGAITMLMRISQFPRKCFRRKSGTRLLMETPLCWL